MNGKCEHKKKLKANGCASVKDRLLPHLSLWEICVQTTAPPPGAPGDANGFPIPGQEVWRLGYATCPCPHANARLINSFKI